NASESAAAVATRSVFMVVLSRDRLLENGKGDGDPSQADARAVAHAEQVERVRRVLRGRGRGEGEPQARAGRDGDDLVEEPDRDPARLRPRPERDPALADDRLGAAARRAQHGDEVVERL